jgi:hypothetical protein
MGRIYGTRQDSWSTTKRNGTQTTDKKQRERERERETAGGAYFAKHKADPKKMYIESNLYVK